jgi:hypothetical protein
VFNRSAAYRDKESCQCLCAFFRAPLQLLTYYLLVQLQLLNPKELRKQINDLKLEISNKDKEKKVLKQHLIVFLILE